MDDHGDYHPDAKLERQLDKEMLEREEAEQQQEMVCSQCGEPTVMGMSVFLMDIGDTLPTWVHLDGEPLCPVMGTDGYEPAKPMTVEEYRIANAHLLKDS